MPAKLFQGTKNKQALQATPMGPSKAKKHYRLRPCPPNLQLLIDVANVPGEQWPGGSRPTRGARFLQRSARLMEMQPKDFRADMESYHKQLPESVKRWIDPFDPEDWRGFERSLAEAFAASDVLEDIARAEKRPLQDIGLLPSIPVKLIGLRIDEKGKIILTPSRLLQTLEGVEADRIRKCPICARFFWAGRMNQPCCGKACANVRRVRKHREVEAYKRTLRRRRK